MSQQNTWISLNQICRWIWIPCSLLLKQPLFESFLAILPYSVVYDPTAFMVCELVIVAWLKAYGATTKPRDPCGIAATCDAARYALVSRLLTKYLYQVTPPHRFVLKFCPWKCSGVQTGNPQQVDAEVFSPGKQEMVWRRKVWHDLGLQKRRMWSRKESKRRVVKEG